MAKDRQRIILARRLMTLAPVNDYGEERLRTIELGDYVLVEFTYARNIKFHNYYWKLVEIIYSNMSDQLHIIHPSQDDLHQKIKVMVGLRTQFIAPPGTMLNPADGTFNEDDVLGFIPGSIAFHKMNEHSFHVFFDAVCNLVHLYFIPGISNAALRHEVERITGERVP